MGGHFLHPLAFIPAASLVFPFLLSSAAWDARIPLSIGQYVSARLIQVDVSTEWCSFVSKTFPITRFSASSSLSASSLLSHTAVCETLPFPHREKQIPTHTQYSATRHHCIAVNVILTSFSEARLSHLGSLLLDSLTL